MVYASSRFRWQRPLLAVSVMSRLDVKRLDPQCLTHPFSCLDLTGQLAQRLLVCDQHLADIMAPLQTWTLLVVHF